MADREKLDKIKEKTGISKLDESTRKDLFNKFVKAGGEVVDDKQKRRQMIIDRNKQRDFQQRMDDHNRRIKSESPATSQGRKVASADFSKSGKTEIRSNFWVRLRIRLKLKFLKIGQFNGLYFEYRFLERFNNIHKPALMEIQVLFFDLFKTKFERGNAIIRRMDAMRPIYFELVEMAGSIYDIQDIDPIVDHYTSFPDVPQKLSELYEPLMDIYRRLLVLHPFENTLFKGFEIGINLATRYAEQDKDKSASYSSYRKKVKNDLYDLFHKLLPRLHWLFCHYQGAIYDMGDPAIEKILGIKPSEKPGNRRLRKPDEETLLQREQLTAEEEDIRDSLPSAVRKGLELMAMLNMTIMRREFDKKNLFQDVPDADKILTTFLLFNEYDREYSPILTTSKIKYNMDFGGGGRSDYRSRMQDLYDYMRTCGDAMRDYAENMSLYELVRAEKPESNNQYIVYTKRLEAIKKKKAEAGRTARSRVKDYMEKVEETVSSLVEDMNTLQRYVANPQEELVFEPNIEGEKKINGLKVYEAIERLYAFVSAFVYRLSPGGDLSGKLEFSEKELEEDSSKTVKPSGDDKTYFGEKSSQEESSGQKSILDELDDLL